MLEPPLKGAKRLEIFMCLSHNAAFRLASALSRQYVLFCSSFYLLYDEEKHQYRFEYMHLLLNLSHSFDI